MALLTSSVKPVLKERKAKLVYERDEEEEPMVKTLVVLNKVLSSVTGPAYLHTSVITN